MAKIPEELKAVGCVSLIAQHLRGTRCSFCPDREKEAIFVRYTGVVQGSWFCCDEDACVKKAVIGSEA